ncbi:DDB1- and CUL4-associated factor 5-like [Ptychodera flava]|uniref:DDB1- and CUL4-associated factor 5-like n=1 Tax=Ptychodera flava TaxID=63121 RepID=UPI00396AA5CA
MLPCRKKSQHRSILKYLYQRQESSHATAPWQMTSKVFSQCENLHRKDLIGHYGCVNAIEFSNHGGELLASGGDDKRVLVWNVQQATSNFSQPTVMKGEHHSNIFCLAFDGSNKKIFSAGNDEQVIVHDIERGETLDVFLHEDTVYGLSVDPTNDNVYASACDDGRVLIWDIRERSGQEPFLLANYTSPFHAVVYNPVEPRLMATANSSEGVGLWDIRAPRSCLMRYGGSLSQQSAMSVKFNNRGDRLLALRRRLPPVLFDIQSKTPLLQFDHSGYYNSCTMKSCCFGGDRDQYALSGSDDFSLYVWKIPDETREIPWVSEAHMVLKGHRSIVNQVRFNPSNHMIASSGVEKIIKVWSPFRLPGSSGDACSNSNQDETERDMYSHEEYIDLVLNSGQGLSHDYSHQSTQEDTQMIAFFDSLLQREVEGWSSLSDSDDSLLSEEGFYVHLMEREQTSSDSSSDSDSDDSSNISNIQEDNQNNNESISEIVRIFDANGRQLRQDNNTGSGRSSQSQSQLDNSSSEVSSPPRVSRRTWTASDSNRRNRRSDCDQSNNNTEMENQPGTSSQSEQRSSSSNDHNSNSRSLLSSPSLDLNHLISLRQRIACRRALREKMNRLAQRNQSNDASDDDITAKLDIVMSQNRLTSSQMRSIQLLRQRIYHEEGEGYEDPATENSATVSQQSTNSAESTNEPTSSSDTNLQHHKKTCDSVNYSALECNTKTEVKEQKSSTSLEKKEQVKAETSVSSNDQYESCDPVTQPNTKERDFTDRNSTNQPSCSSASRTSTATDANTSNVTSMTSANESSSNDTIVEYFCRFKNHKSRSKRNYRKTSPSKEDTSDSDD